MAGRTAATSRPRRLTPLYPGPPDGDVADAATRIAARLATAYHGESVRTLEALAAAEANRLARRDPARFARTGDLDAADRERFRACRRIARRALAGTLATPVAGAAAYHRETARPAWAEGRKPLGEVAGFVFYPAGGPARAGAAGPAALCERR